MSYTTKFQIDNSKISEIFKSAYPENVELKSLPKLVKQMKAIMRRRYNGDDLDYPFSVFLQQMMTAAVEEGGDNGVVFVTDANQVAESDNPSKSVWK